MKNYFREYWARSEKIKRDTSNVKRNAESDIFRDDIFQKCQKSFQR